MPEIKSFNSSEEPNLSHFEKAQGGFSKLFDVFGTLDKFTKIGLVVMGIIILSTPLLIYKTATLLTHAMVSPRITQPPPNPIQIENINPVTPSLKKTKIEYGQTATQSSASTKPVLQK